MAYSGKVCICYNKPAAIYKDYSGKQALQTDPPASEFARNIDAVKASLADQFEEVSVLQVDANMANAYERITSSPPDLIFNLVESLEGRVEYESAVAAMFQLTGIPFTGNTAMCLGNCLNKSICKKILIGSGVATPRFRVAELKNRHDFRCDLEFPLIVKPVCEDSSIGVSELSVVRNNRRLQDRVEYLFTNYRQNILVEEYVEGRELNVSILGDHPLPIGEVNFDGLPDNLPAIVTYEAKWTPSSVYYKHTVPVCPANIDQKTSTKVKAAAAMAYRTMGCRDYARVDIRLSADQVPYVIEVNPNPDILEDSGFVRAAAAAGITYDQLLQKIARLALDRDKCDRDRPQPLSDNGRSG